MSNCSHEAWDFGALQCPDCGAVKGHVADADYAKLEAEAQALREEVAALRARVAVVPERKLLNAGVPGLNRNSGWNACLDELARLNGLTVSESALDTLRKAASGEVKHLNNGLCPDAFEGHEARDPDCPVCRALLSEQEGGNDVSNHQ
ncbi:hypothetical protein RI828_001258 [Pseudomonas aeruginosa]|nr:hypothetical protein [Pseudomonas aeruginosa]ELF6909138.1 hypothetical protein [Pseudomonas aeruginosa]HBO1149156.1 hypothetical protein [Pseudomonas aeruginosa]